MAEPPVVDTKLLRQVAGHFATGVTVITTKLGHEVKGMTANSFTSLSLDPPLVLFCIEPVRSLHTAIEEARAFTVNILAADQEELSRHFAQSLTVEEGHFRDIAHRLGQTGTPILDGVLAYLECQLEMAYEGGDHTIFIGRVVALEILRDHPPLMFFKGKYAQLA